MAPPAGERYGVAVSTAATLLRGSFFRTADLAILLAATFFVTPYLVHSFGDRLYGFWTLVSAVVGYYGFLDLGLTSAAARYMSQALGRDDLDELDTVASTAFFLFAGVAVVVVAATALSALACPWLVGDPAEAALLRRLIVILGLAAAVGFPSKVYSGMLAAAIRFDTLAVISIARTVLGSGGVYLCLSSGRGITAVALVTAGVSVLQYAATYAACRSRHPRLRISLSRFDRAKIGSMTGYGSKTLVCQVGDILRFRLDSMLIAGFLNAGLVTPYAVGVRLAEGFTQVVSSCVGIMLPVFSRYEGRGDYDAIRAALLKVTKLATILSGFIGLSLMFYGRAFIRRWMGPDFDGSYGVAAILCAAFVIGLPQAPGIQLLYGLSKHKFYAVLSVCEGLANVVLSVILLDYFGIYGVALGTLAEMALFKLTVQPVYICRAVSLPVKSYLVDAILLTLLKTAVPLALYFAAIERFVAPDYGILSACVAGQTLLFLPIAYFLILSREERRTVAGAVRTLMPRAQTTGAAAP
jgi:O-antigen/teichoic acid export membrane protein